jgi:hypothetical protein
MSHSPKSLLARCVFLGGLATLFIATFCPIWTIWYINSREGNGYQRSLWFVAVEVGRSCLEKPDPTYLVTRTGDMGDIVVAGIVFGGGALVGSIAFACRSAFSSTAH